MKKTILMALLVCLAGVFVAARADEGGNNNRVLEFRSMAPVTGIFVGADHPIRNVPGGGLPWTIGSARGELDRSGGIEVRVRGLVLADDPAVPANLRLTNPIPMFRAIVSCLMPHLNDMGMPQVVNVSTQPFPASAAGDAVIRDQVNLPETCVAPMVFVTSPTGAWFAATGF